MISFRRKPEAVSNPVNDHLQPILKRLGQQDRGEVEENRKRLRSFADLVPTEEVAIRKPVSWEDGSINTAAKETAEATGAWSKTLPDAVRNAAELATGTATGLVVGLTKGVWKQLKTLTEE